MVRIKSGAVVTFKTTGAIIPGPDFYIENRATVIFHAGTFIQLLLGFVASKDCKFEAKIVKD